MTRRRKHTRLKTFDYSSNGMYFVTVCTHNKKRSLSKIAQCDEISKVMLSPLGLVCEESILDINTKYSDFKVMKHVIMPNHIHMMVEKTADNRLEDKTRFPCTLYDYVGVLKKNVTYKAHLSGILGKIWQESFYEHVVRNEEDMLRILKYIDENPQKWALDRFFKF